MHRTLTVIGSVVAVVTLLALGIAVAGVASSKTSSGNADTTSETTTSETTTTEEPKTTPYRAVLTARAEVPKPKRVRPGARGNFKLELTESSGSYSIAWTLTYRKLTGKARAAHLHRAKPRKAGPVLVTLCRPCRSGRKGERSVSKTVASAMKAGVVYTPP